MADTHIPQNKKWKYVPELLLVLVTILWGTTFILTKNTIQSIPSFLYLAIRFGIAFIAMVPFLFRYRNFFTSINNWKISVVAGTLYFVSIMSQTIGLQFTSASKTSFITALGVIFVPLFVSIFYKQKIHYLLWIAVILAIIGVGLLSLPKVERISIGDPLVLICAITYAFYVIYIGRHLHEIQIIPFTVVQLFIISFFSLIFSLVIDFGIMSEPLEITSIFSLQNTIVLLYLGLIATTLTFILQSYGQRFVSSTRASLIFAFEPFFATLFAILGGELLNWLIGIGMVLIFIAVILSIFSPQKSLQESLTESKIP
ncbi:MAG: DMT family transporter [Candidatus Lokiarchaeota archaeon]|nr:DMT family transporter [Candidatus Lokiarchaeota archaeon]